MPPKLTLADAKADAEKRGGKCLSTEYSDGKMKWVCSVGHEWETKHKIIRHKNSWCRKCYDATIGDRCRKTLEAATALAAKQGGTCLSTKYVDAKSYLRWKCANPKHPDWPATYDNIQQGHWCPKCANEKRAVAQRLDGLKIAAQIASDRGGKCLSNTYKSLQDKLSWKCSLGHIWMATLGHVKYSESWCPECAIAENEKNHAGRLSIIEVKTHIESKGGTLLTDEYKNVHTPMPIRCSKGHEWDMAFANIKYWDAWCPFCTGWKREQRCRESFEALLGAKFPSCTPEWMGGKERLDGYNEALRIAFEHNGIQHYVYTPFFHRNGPEDLERQIERDARVERKCDDNWVSLITIPYTVGNITGHIASILEILGYI